MKRALNILKDTFSDSESGVEQDAIKRLNAAKQKRKTDQAPKTDQTPEAEDIPIENPNMGKPSLIIGKDNAEVQASPLSPPQKDPVIEVGDDGKTVELDTATLKSLIDQKVRAQAEKDATVIQQSLDELKKAFFQESSDKQIIQVHDLIYPNMTDI